MNEQNEGQGGSYAIDPGTGARVLLQRTQAQAMPPDPQPAIAVQDEPAQAGFFTPAAPASPVDAAPTLSENP